MRDVIVSVPANSTISGLDFSRLAKVNLDLINVRAEGAASAPTHKWTFGIRLPESNGEGAFIGKLHASGMYVGVVANSAHITAQLIESHYRYLGFGITADHQYGPIDGHAAIIQYLGTEACTYHLASWNPTKGVISMPAGEESGHVFAARVVVGLWDLEDAIAGQWYTTVQHLVDENNQLYGRATFARVGSGSGTTFKAIGGANLARRNIKLVPEGSGRIGEVLKVTGTNATWPIPEGAQTLEMTCVAGGGGGGGGGSTSEAKKKQVGGAGGTAGIESTQIVSVGSNTTLAVTVGAGGEGGAGGASNGKAGSDGKKGGNTTVVGTAISVAAVGDGRGKGSAPNSETVVGTAPQGNNSQGSLGSNGSNRGGEGGSSSTEAGNGQGGFPFLHTGGGGGGGGRADGSAKGGTGGKAGNMTGAASPGEEGKSGRAAGTEGESAAANTAAGGGGGGGGGYKGGEGGKGGNGGSGLVLIRVVG